MNEVVVNNGPGDAWEPAPPIAGATNVIGSTCSRIACLAVTAQGTVWAFESFTGTGGWNPQGNEFRLPAKRGLEPGGGISCDPAGTFCLALVGYRDAGGAGFGFKSPAARVYVTRYGPTTDFEQLVPVGKTPYGTIDGPALLPSCGAAGICMAITDPSA